MFSVLRPRMNAIATGVLVALLVGTVAVAAGREEGFRATKVDLHDAGVWVTKRKAAGRVNTEIRELEALVQTDLANLDVLQDEDVVLGYATRGDAPTLIAIDAASEVPMDQQQVVLPSGALAQMAGGTVAVVDPTEGLLWVASSEGAASLSTDPSAVVHRASGRGADREVRLVAAVGVDGAVHAYEPGADSAWRITLDGAAEEVRLESPVTRPMISSVGSRAVILDREGGRLQVIGGRTVELNDIGRDATLQLPGPGDPRGAQFDTALVAGGGVLLDVPLDSGPPSTLSSRGGSVPVRPVRASGCAYGAWSDEEAPRYARVCDSQISRLKSRGAGEAIEPPDNMRVGKGAVFRLNRGRAVLNDVNSGDVLMVDLPEPTVVRDWDKLEPNNGGDGKTKTTSDEDVDCSKEPPPGPPQVSAQVERGTRPNRPVVVPLVGSDAIEAHPCDALLITVDPDAVAPDLGAAHVVANGTAIQVTTTGTTPVTVPFTVLGMAGEATGSLVVGVSADGDNQDPRPFSDSNVVAVNGRVTHNVLANDVDPDGDPLKLVEVTVDGAGNEAPPQFRADGAITYVAGPQAGDIVIHYTVEDDRGGSAEGEFVLGVRQGQQPPQPVPDQVVTTVGSRAIVDVLANDSDPDTAHEELRFTGLNPEPGSLGIRKPTHSRSQGSGVLMLEPTAEGEHLLTYTVSDNSEARSSVFRVVVRPKSQQPRPPVAVRDEVAVRGGVPALVDVLANDVDPDGDLLAVTSIDAGSTGLGVEVVDLRMARVIVPEGLVLANAVDVHYTVSDGEREARGTIVVAPYEPRVENQRPVAVDDEATVKAGRWTSVDVVANDVDPEGEALKIVEVSTPTDQDGREIGRVFARGNEIRFRPNEDARGTAEINYTVEDPGRQTDVAVLRVTITPPDAENEPPFPRQLVEGRAWAGEPTVVSMPLLSMDPDGDVVSVIGPDPDVPPSGAVEADGMGFRYTAPAEGAGTDRFNVLVTDGEPGHEVAVEIRVVIVRRPTVPLPPVAVPDLFTVRAGSAERTLPVLENDTDPDVPAGDQELVLVTDGVEAPSLREDQPGTLVVRDGEIRYTPPPVTDAPLVEVAFHYTVRDPGGLTSRGVARIRITDGADPVPPLAVDDLHAPVEAGAAPVDIDVLANDTDPDDPDFPGPSAIPVVLDPETVPEASVQPDGTIRVAVADRSVQFAYEVTDADGATAQAIVVVPVRSALPPVAASDELTLQVGESRELDVLENDEPRDRVRLRQVLEETAVGVSVALSADKSKVVLTGGAEPVVGGVSYLIADEATGLTDVGWVSVTVEDQEQNEPPTFQMPSTMSLEAGGPGVDWNLATWAKDPEDDTISFELTQAPAAPVEVDRSALANGRLVARVASKTAPASSTSLVVTATDGENRVTSTVTVQVVANPGPVLPFARTDERQVRVDDGPLTVDVVANDTYAPEVTPSITVMDVSGAPSGRVTTDGSRSITFTPASGDTRVVVRYNLTDDFKYDDGSTGPPRASESTLTITVFSRPEKPEAPHGEAGSKVVNLRWRPPRDNGLAIRGYVVEAENQANGSRTQQEVFGTQISFGGLTNGDTYKFRVAAFNEQYPRGEVADEHYGPWSAPFTPDKRPEQPGQPQVEFRMDDNPEGGGRLHVSWTEPSNEGSAITGYTIESDAGGRWQVGPGERTLAVNGLTNGTSYRFRIIATNALGDSDPSPFSVAAVPAGKPGKPGKPTVRQLSQNVSDTLTVNVQFDRADPNGDEPTYTVRLVGGESKSGSPGSGGVDFSNLNAGQNYSFEVTAKNKAGETTSDVTTFVGYNRPGPPINLRTTYEYKRVDLTWSAPSITGSGSGGRLRYRVIKNGTTLDEVDDRSFTDNAVSPKDRPVYVVVAINANSPELISDPSNSVTANVYGDPSVTINANKTGPRDISWSWSADWNGAGKQDYILEWRQGGGNGGTVTTESLTRSGLSWDTTYELCVTARSNGSDTQPSPRQCASARTDPEPQPDFTMSRGGLWNPPGYTCTDSCYRVMVTTSNIPPGTYSHICWEGTASEIGPYNITAGTNQPSDCAAEPGITVTMRIYGNGIDVTRTWVMTRP